MEMIAMIVALALLHHVIENRGESEARRQVIIFAVPKTQQPLKGLEVEKIFTENAGTNFQGRQDSSAETFSDWSKWSGCSSDCEQTKMRRYQKGSKWCRKILKETRPCSSQHTRGNKRKCHRIQNRRNHEHKEHEVHIVRLFHRRQVTLESARNFEVQHASHSSKPPRRRNDRRYISTPLFQPDRSLPVKTENNTWSIPSKNSSPQITQNHTVLETYTSPRSEPLVNINNASRISTTMAQSMTRKNRKLERGDPNSPILMAKGGRGIRRNAMVTAQLRMENKLYGRWGPWADCSIHCTTTRYRWCKRRSVCGNDVMSEAAYCYLEGTYCQHWINRKIQQNEENEADVDFYVENFNNRRGKAREDARKSNLKPDTAPRMSECGIAGTSSARWSMMRIIGGRPTSKGRWPWQVAVLNRYKETFCGGTLVAPLWVLTAAHCIRKRLYVRLGEHDLSQAEGTEVELRVSQMVPHPSYDPETVDNDVALLRLPMVVEPDRFRGLACLPKPRQLLPTSQYCTIIGWGKRKSSDTFGTDLLHEAEVPIVPNDVCRSVYEDYHITHNMFCAGYRRGRMDSCAGDSGGPLLCKDGNKWTIFGITSFGEGCGKRGKYGIYTRLSNYIKWIQRTIKEKKKY